ncbi:DNA polymerase III subunit beta [Clostridium sp. C2-6-12]|uniref:DNA polymerase III subunit beta n=1 Tax=Clostridium sp. C2-6-12 TaxID=2698832 RepID=UPI00136FF44B|nr:DNA polymerase III subunit beta [Clostridium sp. C2-6-12]
MKAIVNSESLFLLKKLVKNGVVKLLAESKDHKCQVEIIEPNNIDKEEGVLSIPEQVFSLLPRKTSLIVRDKVIKSDKQELNFENKDNQIQEIEMSEGRCFDITNFSELIEVVYARTKEEIRPVLRCILIDKCNFVALDGYRMSVRSSIEDMTDKQIIIPGSIVEMLNNFKKSDIATVYENDNYIKICFGWISITASKEKDLQFISYDSLIPKEHKTKVIVNSSELVSLCKQIGRLDQGYSNLLRIKFNTDSSYATAKNQELKIKRYFSAEVEGEELEIGINSRYLLEALKNYTGNATLYINNPINPILVTDEKNKKDLVLPIRLIR